MHLYSRSVLFALSLIAAGAALAQPYPNKPIHWIVGFAAGGGADILARTVAPKLGEALGQQIVVDNRPGAAGNIAMEYVVKSPPDGYTWLMGSPGLASNPSLYPKLSFDPIRDFATVAMLGAVPNLMVVRQSLPATSVKEFIALARSNPGKLNFASSGTGSSLHLAAELLKSMANIEMTHVPYKGSSLAENDLIGGQVDVFFDVLPSAAPYVKAGRIRALAITDLKRSSLFPDLPTMDEAGVPGYRAVTWNAVLAPAGTPKEVIAKINFAVAKLLQSAEMKERFAAIGTEPLLMTPDQFASFLREETTKWSGVIRKAGIKLE